MKKYETLEHKADLKIRAFGKTKEELFLNMMKGMISGLRPKIKSQKSKVKSIKVQSLDLGALLVDFLSRVLYLSQVNKEIYKDIKFQKLTNRELGGELIGQKVERFGEDIKAVTYHSLDVHQEKGIWQATILFDV